jgi:hypothetical protein
MGEKQNGGKSAGEKVRICKLKADGKLGEVDQHELNPIVYCNKCKAKAGDPSYICNPRALKQPKAGQKA